MLVDHDRRGQGGPYRDETFAGAAGPRRLSPMRRFLGGSPAGVFLRLLFLSALAGAFMSMLGLTPERLFWRGYNSVRALVEISLASLHDFGGWLAAGAVVVVPLWVISRLLAVSR